MKTLETERLILRDWKESDLNDMFEYAHIEGVGEMAGWQHHENIDVSKNILNSFIINGDVYAVVLKDSNKVIGSVGVHNKSLDQAYKADNQREIGYVLSKDYWGRGLMPEAVREVIKYAFDDLGMDVLWCGHFTFNQQSKRVIEKNGFKFYNTGVYEAKALGKSFDEKIYILTNDEYRARQA